MTPAEISAAAATASAAAASPIDPAQMVALIDAAIAVAIANGDIVVSYTVSGRLATRSLDQARALRDYYQREVDRLAARAVPCVSLTAELG